MSSSPESPSEFNYPDKVESSPRGAATGFMGTASKSTSQYVTGSSTSVGPGFPHGEPPSIASNGCHQRSISMSDDRAFLNSRTVWKDSVLEEVLETVV